MEKSKYCPTVLRGSLKARWSWAESVKILIKCISLYVSRLTIIHARVSFSIIRVSCFPPGTLKLVKVTRRYLHIIFVNAKCTMYRTGVPYNVGKVIVPDETG